MPTARPRLPTFKRASTLAILLACWMTDARSDLAWQGLDRAEHIMRICGEERVLYRCATRVDSVLLSQHPDRVWRTERGLHFRTSADSVLVLEDYHCDCASALRHTLLGSVPGLSADIVLASMYEGQFFVLVNTESADTLHLQSFPVVSPDEKHFVTTSCDISLGDSANQLQIWALRDDFPPVLEWSMRPGWDLVHPDPRVNNWGPIRPRWRDATTVSISVFAYMDVGETRPNREPTRRHMEAPGELLFRLVDGKWLFRGYDP